MSSTHHQLFYHIVFSTKNRQPYLQQPERRQSMFEYLGGSVRGLDGVPVCIGGWIDHVHLLIKLTPSHCVADLLRQLKATSSKHMNDTSHQVHKFGWQEGYGAFTVGSPQKEIVIRYIQNQESHHRQATFKQEYVHLLTLAEIEYDERYLWD